MKKIAIGLFMYSTVVPFAVFWMYWFDLIQRTSSQWFVFFTVHVVMAVISTAIYSEAKP